jgi:hypothetical protein
MGRIVRVIMPTIEAIVDNKDRPIVIAQRTPSDIINSMIPVYPSRPPTPGWDPIPTQATSPVPAAVMGNTPSPWLIRTPCPTTNRIPDPSPMVIGSPCGMVNIGDPNIPIGPFVHPFAVVIQLGLVFIQLDRQITRPHISVVE